MAQQEPTDDSRLAAFRADVWAHFRANRREMPWRDVDDPYAVLVSEVMLQQTQVARVLPAYERWMEAFPDVRTLAGAPLPAVLERWQGLGYNRRALRLKRTAQDLVTRWEGRVPKDVRILRALPGVGPVTAAAIVNYAFRTPTPFIETNVRAVYLDRFFPEAERVPDRALRPIVEATWDLEDPRGWGYALMDLGVHIKQRRANPSRRSSAHRRQSAFEGSRRQTRARLLRAVLGEPGLATEAYAEAAGVAPDRGLELLEELRSEGFLVRDPGRWSIAD